MNERFDPYAQTGLLSDLDASLPSEDAAAGPHSAPVGPKEIDGRYEVVGILGSGGMGSVYKVVDTMLDEVVALKTLNTELAQDAHSLSRFRREVKLARRVTHPNVARTFDIGTADGFTYLTMEFVDGESLRARHEADDPPTIIETLRVMAQVCEGLQAAHDAGVIHRDLKPANVMLSTSGRVVITDFGVARAPRRRDNLTQTSGGGVMGTPQYMAPEQVEGTEELDGRADVYAAGVMLFELLSGAPPWTGESLISMAVARLMGPPPRLCLPDAPDALVALVARAMARDRRARYATSAELAKDLRALAENLELGNLRVPATRPAPPAHTPAPRVETLVAVLPAHNRSGPELDHVAHGLTDELAGELAMLDGILVKPHGALRHLDTSMMDAQEMGRQLGVRVVVDSSMRRKGDSLRVRVALISVDDGLQVWGDKFSGPVSDIFDIAEDAAEAIADALAARRLHGARPQALHHPVAIDLYMRAKRAMASTWHEGSSDALELLTRAHALCPDEPRILTALATAHSHATIFGRDDALISDHHALARRYAERAVALAPRWANPHYAMALVSYNLDDLATALRHAKATLDLQPNHAHANHLIGRIYARLGPLELATRHLERAMSIDTDLCQAALDLARVRTSMGEWDAADALLDCLVASERPAAAVANAWKVRFALWRGVTPSDDLLTRLTTLRRIPRVFARCASLLLSADPIDALREHLPAIAAKARARRNRSRLYQYELSFVVEFAALAGLDELALDALEEYVGLGHHDPVWLESNPLFNRLRKEPRFVFCLRAAYVAHPREAFRSRSAPHLAIG
jgi:serine/threonine-protein kinase